MCSLYVPVQKHRCGHGQQVPATPSAPESRWRGTWGTPSQSFTTSTCCFWNVWGLHEKQLDAQPLKAAVLLTGGVLDEIHILSVFFLCHMTFSHL